MSLSKIHKLMKAGYSEQKDDMGVTTIYWVQCLKCNQIERETDMANIAETELVAAKNTSSIPLSRLTPSLNTPSPIHYQHMAS